MPTNTRRTLVFSFLERKIAGDPPRIDDWGGPPRDFAFSKSEKNEDPAVCFLPFTKNKILGDTGRKQQKNA